MDTSEHYIKMCERATEIQDAKLHWLPRQDQLQEMVFNPSYGGHTISIHWIRNIAHYVESKGDLDYYKLFTSMEQFWLAFVMKEKYQKIWDGEAWVDAD